VTEVLFQQQQSQGAPPTPPTPPVPVKRFSVWNGVTIQHKTIKDLAEVTLSLVPDPSWTKVELYLKAGEGGTWQSAWDSSPLALSGPASLEARIRQGLEHGIRIIPYVVVRGRTAWLTPEQVQIKQCADIAGRCVLNLEPGAQYWNGPNNPTYIKETYLAPIGVSPDKLQLCAIPRLGQVVELGGPECLRAWTNPQYVGSASWETYGIVAPSPGLTSLLVSEAIPRLDQWGITPGWEYRIPCVQRGEITRWSGTDWCEHAMEVWHLDGNI
jgi:hypothetical protein